MADTVVGTLLFETGVSEADFKRLESTVAALSDRLGDALNSNDFTNFRKGLEGITSEAKQARDVLDNLDKTALKFGSGTKNVPAAFNAASGAVEEFREKTLGLRGAIEAGLVSQREGVKLARQFRDEALNAAKGAEQWSREQRQLLTSAARADRTLATLEGRVTKLGLSQNVMIGSTRNLTTQFQSLHGTLVGVLGVAGAGGLLRMFSTFSRDSFDAAVSLRLFNREIENFQLDLREGATVLSRLATEFQTTEDVIASGAVQLLRYGANLEQTETLLRAGAASALAFGRDSAAGIEAVAQAIVGEQSQILNRIGIAGNLSTAYRDMARDVGVATDALTQEQKVQAAVNLIMRETQQEVAAVSEVMSGFAGAQNKFNTSLVRFRRELGENVQPVLQRTYETATFLMDSFRQLPDALQTFIIAAGTATIAATALAAAFAALQLVLAPILGTAGIIAAGVGVTAGLVAVFAGGQDSLEDAANKAREAIGNATDRESLAGAVEEFSKTAKGDAKQALKEYAQELRNATDDAIDLGDAIERANQLANNADYNRYTVELFQLQQKYASINAEIRDLERALEHDPAAGEGTALFSIYSTNLQNLREELSLTEEQINKLRQLMLDISDPESPIPVPNFTGGYTPPPSGGGGNGGAVTEFRSLIDVMNEYWADLDIINTKQKQLGESYDGLKAQLSSTRTLYENLFDPELVQNPDFVKALAQTGYDSLEALQQAVANNIITIEARIELLNYDGNTGAENNLEAQVEREHKRDIKQWKERQQEAREYEAQLTAINEALGDVTSEAGQTDRTGETFIGVLGADARETQAQLNAVSEALGYVYQNARNQTTDATGETWISRQAREARQLQAILQQLRETTADAGDEGFGFGVPQQVNDSAVERIRQQNAALDALNSTLVTSAQLNEDYSTSQEELAAASERLRISDTIDETSASLLWLRKLQDEGIDSNEDYKTSQEELATASEELVKKLALEAQAFVATANAQAKAYAQMIDSIERLKPENFDTGFGFDFTPETTKVIEQFDALSKELLDLYLAGEISNAQYTRGINLLNEYGEAAVKAAQAVDTLNAITTAANTAVELLTTDWSDGNDVLTSYFNTMATIAEFIPVFGEAAANAIRAVGQLWNAVLGDMSNGLRAVRQETQSLADQYDLLTDTLISSLVVTKQVSRGGLLGLLGFDKTVIDDEATNFGLSIADQIANGMIDGFNGSDWDKTFSSIIRNQLIRSFILTPDIQAQIAELTRIAQEIIAQTAAGGEPDPALIAAYQEGYRKLAARADSYLSVIDQYVPDPNEGSTNDGNAAGTRFEPFAQQDRDFFSDLFAPLVQLTEQTQYLKQIRDNTQSYARQPNQPAPVTDSRNQTINIYQLPNQSARELARLVAEEMKWARA